MISIIMLTKNSASVVGDAVSSLVAQTDQNFEFIVQDGASKDNTIEIIKNIYPAAKIVSEKDRDMTDAAEKALKRCQGDIIGFLDSDNLFPVDAIEIANKYFLENEEVDIFYGNSILFSDAPEEGDLWISPDYDYYDVLLHKIVPPWSAAFFKVKPNEFTFSGLKEMRTCYDFPNWLNFKDKNIRKLNEVLSFTRLSDHSFSCAPQNYEQMCQDKIIAFDNHTQRYFNEYEGQLLRKIFLMNLYEWACYFSKADKEIFTNFSIKLNDVVGQIVSPNMMEYISKVSGKITHTTKIKSVQLDWDKRSISKPIKSLFNINKALKNAFAYKGKEYDEIIFCKVTSKFKKLSSDENAKYLSIELELSGGKAYFIIYKEDERTSALDQQVIEEGNQNIMVPISILKKDYSFGFRVFGDTERRCFIKITDTYLSC